MRVLVRNLKSSEWDFAEPVSTRAEADLQRLLIESPSLIPADEIREDVSPLVVAVGEIGLPGSGSTDVLAVTADGDIALVECKLAANPESKRKVIGQILEYAACLWGMSYEDLDSRVRARRGKPLARLVEEAVAGEWDESSFRTGISQTLQTGAFLLIIVVDEINEELRRIVRYIAECGRSDYSFHALELRMYRTSGLELLVPHLHGVSAGRPDTESKRRKWTEQEFFADLAAKVQPQELAIAEDLYQWGQDTADRMWFGTGAQTGSVTYHFLPHGKTASVFTIFTDGRFCLNYGFMNEKFEQSILRGFHERVTAIASFAGVAADFAKWPTIRLAEAFPGSKELAQFKQAVEWLRGPLYDEE